VKVKKETKKNRCVKNARLVLYIYKYLVCEKEAMPFGYIGEHLRTSLVQTYNLMNMSILYVQKIIYLFKINIIILLIRAIMTDR
jgi:hypothetical protein